MDRQSTGRRRARVALTDDKLSDLSAPPSLPMSGWRGVWPGGVSVASTVSNSIYVRRMIEEGKAVIYEHIFRLLNINSHNFLISSSSVYSYGSRSSWRTSRMIWTFISLELQMTEIENARYYLEECYLVFSCTCTKVLCVIYNLTTCTCEYFLALYFPSSVRTLCASRYGREMNKKENAFEGRKLVRTSRGPPLPSFYTPSR